MEWQQHYARISKEVSDCHTILWGDSLTKHLSSSVGWDIFLGDGVLNAGIPGERVEWLFHRVLNSYNLSHVKHHVILIGTNNVNIHSPEETASTILALSRHLQFSSPRSTVSVLNLLPRYDNFLSSKFINEVNHHLSILQESFPFKNVFLRSLPEELSNHLDSTHLFSKDGIHLTQKGSWILSKWIGRLLFGKTFQRNISSIPLHNQFSILTDLSSDEGSSSGHSFTVPIGTGPKTQAPSPPVTTPSNIPSRPCTSIPLLNRFSILTDLSSDEEPYSGHFFSATDSKDVLPDDTPTASSISSCPVVNNDLCVNNEFMFQFSGGVSQREVSKNSSKVTCSRRGSIRVGSRRWLENKQLKKVKHHQHKNKYKSTVSVSCIYRKSVKLQYLRNLFPNEPQIIHKYKSNEKLLKKTRKQKRKMGMSTISKSDSVKGSTSDNKSTEISKSNHCLYQVFVKNLCDEVLSFDIKQESNIIPCVGQLKAHISQLTGTPLSKFSLMIQGHRISLTDTCKKYQQQTMQMCVEGCGIKGGVAASPAHIISIIRIKRAVDHVIFVAKIQQN